MKISRVLSTPLHHSTKSNQAHKDTTNYTILHNRIFAPFFLDFHCNLPVFHSVLGKHNFLANFL